MDRRVLGVALMVAAIVIVICVVVVEGLYGWGLLPLVDQYETVSTPDPAAMDYTVVINPATVEFDLLLPGAKYHCTCSDYFNGASVECVCEGSK